MIELKIIINEDGQVDVGVNQEMPIYMAMGILEVAKNILVNGQTHTVEETVEE